MGSPLIWGPGLGVVLPAGQATAGGILYTDGSSVQNTGAGTANYVLKSNGASAPTWAIPASGSYTETTAQETTGTSYSTTAGTWTSLTGVSLSLAAGTYDFYLRVEAALGTNTGTGAQMRVWYAQLYNSTDAAAIHTAMIGYANATLPGSNRHWVNASATVRATLAATKTVILRVTSFENSGTTTQGASGSLYQTFEATQINYLTARQV